MPQWRITLKGTAEDLCALAEWIPDGEIFAVVDSGSVHLAGSTFDRESQAIVVFELAREYVCKASDSSQLLSITSGLISVNTVLRIADDGTRTEHGFGGGNAVVSVSTRRHISTINGKTTLQVVVDEATRSLNLEAALAAWNRNPTSWPWLYRALEEIETYLGKTISEAEICSKDVRKHFMRCANTAEIAGSDSRHGFGKFKPPEQAMSLHDARLLLRAAIEHSAVMKYKERAA